MGFGLVLGILACLIVILRSGPPAQRASEALPVIGPVAPFALINQAGTLITRDNLLGKVWVADIIFTRCAGPCPEMTRKMKELQDALPATSSARLVTLTTDADFDTPEVLRRYGERFGADFGRWTFLTGDKVGIANLAIDSLKLTAIAKKPEERTDPNDLFVHSTIFVLVDKRGNLRGSFESVSDFVPWTQVKQDILAALARLEREP